MIPHNLKPLPDRDLIRRIIDEEAKAAGVDPSIVLGGAPNPPSVVTARHRAINRILVESGCSQLGLAKVWGISDATVRAASYTPPRRHVYDSGTVDRLTSAHGWERAAIIVAGRDELTNLDIAAWKRVCGRAEA